MMTEHFTADELHHCALREVRMRRRVYPRWVQNGKISFKHAQEEIEKMQAIAEHFAELVIKERLL
jgi:hypothetical protein